MSAARSARSYQTIAVQTAPPGRLVLMLFDGALRFLATAAAASYAQSNLAERFEAMHNNLVKAQDVLRELQTSLNMEAGGEFSERMFALYDFMISQLREANQTKEVAPIQVVEKLLQPIRDAWAQMLVAPGTSAP